MNKQVESRGDKIIRHLREDLRESCPELEEGIQALEFEEYMQEVEKHRKDHERYQRIKRMSPDDFKKLSFRCLEPGVDFDSEVDKLQMDTKP